MKFIEHVDDIWVTLSLQKGIMYFIMGISLIIFTLYYKAVLQLWE